MRIKLFQHSHKIPVNFITNRLKYKSKMLIGVLLLLFSLQHNLRVHCEVLATTLPNNKDNRLVDFLKQNLRRNNDDYVEKLNINKDNPQSVSTQSVIINNIKQQDADNNTKYINNNQNEVNGTNRRNLNYDIMSGEEKNNQVNPKASDPTAAAQPIDVPDIATNMPDIHNPTEANQQILIKNPDKLRHFIEKNQDLLQQFISNKGIGLPVVESSPTSTPTPTPTPTTTESAATKQALRLRKEHLPHEVQYARTPSAAELDMAPAIGSVINSMRIKGRLCNRNVLVPEGPKYNSKGEVYLKAYKPKGRSDKIDRDYPNTRAPRLVLPKCCNCCKKSVLGCE